MLIKINMLTQKFNTYRHSGMVLDIFSSSHAHIVLLSNTAHGKLPRYANQQECERYY